MSTIQAERSAGLQVEATGRPVMDAVAPSAPAQAMALGDVQPTLTSMDLAAAMVRADGAVARARQAVARTSELLDTLRQERQLVRQARDQARDAARQIRQRRRHVKALAGVGADQSGLAGHAAP